MYASVSPGRCGHTHDHDSSFKRAGDLFKRRDAAGRDGVRSKTDLIGLQEWTPLARVVRTENPQAVQGNIISPQGEIDGGLQDKVRLVVGVMDMCV